MDVEDLKCRSDQRVQRGKPLLHGLLLSLSVSVFLSEYFGKMTVVFSDSSIEEQHVPSFDVTLAIHVGLGLSLPESVFHVE